MVPPHGTGPMACDHSLEKSGISVSCPFLPYLYLQESNDKMMRVASEIEEMIALGRPVLVGTQR